MKKQKDPFSRGTSSGTPDDEEEKKSLSSACTAASPARTTGGDTEEDSNPHSGLLSLHENDDNDKDSEVPSDDYHQKAEFTESHAGTLLFTGRQRRRRQRLEGRWLLRIGACLLLAIAVTAIALPTLTYQKREQQRAIPNVNANQGLPSPPSVVVGSDSVSNDPPSSNTVAPTPVAPMEMAEQAICIQVSYDINRLNLTADDVLFERGNTLKTGLEIAALQVAHEFVVQQQQEESRGGATRRRRAALVVTRHLSSLYVSPDEYPATVTNVMDISAFCTTPNCLVITQSVCVVWQPSTTDTLTSANAVELGLRQAVKNAITTGDLIDKVPVEHLPP